MFVNIDEVIVGLSALYKYKGYISYSDINDYLPSGEIPADLIGAIVSRLKAGDIEISENMTNHQEIELGAIIKDETARLNFAIAALRLGRIKHARNLIVASIQQLEKFLSEDSRQIYDPGVK